MVSILLGLALAVAMGCAVCLKQPIDPNGHDAGDQLLKLLVRLVRENTTPRQTAWVA